MGWYGGGYPNGAFLGTGLAAFGVISAIALWRTLELAGSNEWFKPPIRAAFVSMVGLTALAVLIPLVRSLQAQFGYRHDDLSAHYVLVLGFCVALIYSMLWIVVALYQKRLDDEASTDELTGSLNRTGINHAIRRHFSGSVASPVVVLHIDIDQFQKINDHHGRETGDRVLREVARALSTSCRSNDFVARTGGEEFVIACVGADPTTALELAERIRNRIGNTEIFLAEGQPVSCSVSIGLSAPCAGYANWTEAWRQADTALYRAKSLGCNICISHRSAR